MKEKRNTLTNLITDNSEEDKIIFTNVREELRPFLNKKIKASGRVEKMKIKKDEFKRYHLVKESILQLLLKEVKLITPHNKDLKYHVNIFAPSNQLISQKIKIGDRVTFQAIVRQYKSYKPIEGIMIKLKNYSFNDIKILEIEKR